MDAISITSLASSLTQQRLGQDVAVTVLKKALDIQATTAASLLSTLPPVSTTNLPPHLGQTINTVA